MSYPARAERLINMDSWKLYKKTAIHSPDTPSIPPKYLRPCRHPPKKRRLRHQAINLATPGRVRAWWTTTWGSRSMSVTAAWCECWAFSAPSSGGLDQRARDTRYLSCAPPNGQMRHKGFFLGGSNARPYPQTRNAAPKLPRVSSAFL